MSERRFWFVLSLYIVQILCALIAIGLVIWQACRAA